MFLSHILVNTGIDPDRPRPGRQWLRNRYRVHQRLCMAFPEPSRLINDRDFLKPYVPEDFGGAHIHVKRAEDAGFLFRVDSLTGGRVIILVQSAVIPNWDYAFHNADYLIDAPPVIKPYDPGFTEGQRLRFCIAANPTRKIDTKTKADGKKRNGRRVPVPHDQLDEWLIKRGAQNGFSIESVTSKNSYVYVNKSHEGSGHKLFCARYDGILVVTDSDNFLKTLISGIGPGKSFGFGLLSVVPVPLSEVI
ncbi:MAG: type I-E CRISPR-associated protein Cas6/Cse3/CasE [Nitrospirae bacterium]|nr:type I-E CRISPR-associated protein Cas6/Cse3/CasE [Nitrospirota bacterium]